jgi:Xaa-Pro aminopeptidase
MNSRVSQLRSQLADKGLDAVLISEPHNRRYICGFTGSTGHVLISAKEALFITDFRYTDQAAEQCVGYEIVNQGNSFTNAMAHQLQVAGVKSLAFEQDYLTYGEVENYRSWEQDVPGLSLIPTSMLVESIRILKDSSEVELIQKAADISDAAFEHILSFLKPGLTEREVAFELESFMVRQGATGPSFESIVASGWRSSLPHGTASDKVLELGDFVKFDFGALYQGYCSDLTRTVVLGTPNDKQREIYNIVLEAQLRSLEAAKVGLTGKELDAVARDYITSKGYGDNFGHSLGHGLGLAVHEEPRVSTSGSTRLEAGMVVTIEPGIYISKWGGVRIEDDILLTEDGKRIFNHAPKLELICVK